MTDEEVKIVDKYFGAGGIHHGNVKSNKAAALKEFTLYSQTGVKKKIGLNLVYPKGDKTELRLYLRGKVFMPEADSIWFIFVSNGELVIGSLPEDKWRSLGREDVEDDNYIADIYDEPKEPQQRQAAGGLIWKRNPQLAIARFKITNFRCEVDPGHKLFISRATNQPFLEAHHLLPMKHQQFFKTSLDVKDNITALCPFCHRLIHHATVKETRPMLDSLFASRMSLAQQFKVDKTALYRFYNCEEIFSD